MGELYFEKDGLCRYVSHNKPRLDFPQTPLPPNIKSFHNIQIKHFDTNTLDFLRNIQPLLTGVELSVDAISAECLADLPTILTNLAPFVGGIRSLDFKRTTLPVVQQCFTREQMAQLKVLKYLHYDYATMDAAWIQETVNSIMDWLASGQQQDNNNRGDYEPRLYEVHLWLDRGFSEQIITAIRQQFLAAKTPCTFAVMVSFAHYRKAEIAEFHLLENGIGEELHGEWTENVDFQISRHRANCKQQLYEWIKENTKRGRHGCIEIYYPTIGTLDAVQVDVQQPMDEEQNIQQQPCSSRHA